MYNIGPDSGGNKSKTMGALLFPLIRSPPILYSPPLEWIHGFWGCALSYRAKLATKCFWCNIKTKPLFLFILTIKRKQNMLNAKIMRLSYCGITYWYTSRNNWGTRTLSTRHGCLWTWNDMHQQWSHLPAQLLLSVPERKEKAKKNNIPSSYDYPPRRQSRGVRIFSDVYCLSVRLCVCLSVFFARYLKNRCS